MNINNKYMKTWTMEINELKEQLKVLRKKNRALRKDLKWWDDQARQGLLPWPGTFRRRDKRSSSGWSSGSTYSWTNPDDLPEPINRKYS